MGLTLVAAGCSHTQGIAFTKFIKNREEPDSEDWASEEIRKKYHPQKCTHEFITNNLTWMGKLKQLLKPKDGRDLYLQGDQIDNIVNLGYGGLGTSTAIRSIWNYCDKVEDITDHIFVVQPQSIYRNEVYYKKLKAPNQHQWPMCSLMDGLQHDHNDIDEMFKHFDMYFFDEDVEWYKYYVELSRIQKYVEAKGADFRVLHNWWPLPTRHWNSEIIKKLESTYHTSNDVGWEKQLQTEKGVVDLLNSLNIINTTNGHLYHKDRTKGHLHTEGLLEGDMHYSELGNEYLANCIYDNFNNVIQFEMNNNNLNFKRTTLVNQIDMNNKKAVKYFKLFEEGNLEGLSEMYHEDIHLIDWNGEWKGKEEVLKMNKGLFDSNKVEVVVHEIEQPIFRESRVYCTISITLISDTSIVLKVMDIIDFDNKGKITRIEAFNG